MIKFLINSECFKLFTILLLCLLKSHNVLSACSDDEWHCDDASCIPLQKRCDGIADCKDRSDEIAENCIHLYRGCPKVDFTCTYGACITKNRTCNGIQDCADNSDELVCPPETWKKNLQGRCGEDELQCLRSKECIRKELTCNGHKDCADGTDETVEVCAEYKCPEVGFHCGYGGCISEDARCNGTVECIDGSDEAWELCGTPRKTLGSRINPTTVVQPKSTTALQPTQAGMSCKIPDGLDALVITLLHSGAQLAPGSLVNDNETIQAKCKNRNEEKSRLFCFGGKLQGNFPACRVFCEKSFFSGISTTYFCHQNGMQQEARCSPSILPNTSISVFCSSGFRRKLNEKRLPCQQYCGKWPPLSLALTIYAYAPWHVAIFQNFDGNQINICGGSIISRRLIITAANCFDAPTSPHLYRIIAGKQTEKYMHDSDNIGLPQEIEVEKIHISEKYEDLPNHYYADIALLTLKAPLIYNELVSSVCMYDPEGDSQDYVYSNIIGSISGYGRYGILRSLDMGTLSYEFCQNLDNGSELAHDKFCVRNENVTSTLCRGDTGGGFVVERDGAFYLLGIVSYAPGIVFRCVTSDFVVMSNVRQMRPDLWEVWQREMKKDQELFFVHCGHGGCINEDARCNDTIACVDGSDEAWELCGTPRKTLGVRINPTTAVQPKSTAALQPTDGAMSCKIPDGLDALVITLLNSGDQLAPGSLVNDDESIQAKCKTRNNEAKDLWCFGGKWRGEFPTCLVSCDASILRGISTTYYCHPNDVQQEAWCSFPILPNTTIDVYCSSGFRRTPSRVQKLFCMRDGKLNENRLPCEQYCGQLTPAHRKLTRNGFAIIPSEAPWHVAIFQYVDGEQRHICGGSIISPTLIITAAHCFWNNTVPTAPHLYRIIAGKQSNKYTYDINKERPQDIQVEQIYISEKYEDLPNHYYADIALLKLKAPVIYNENVSSLCMYDPVGDNQDYVNSNITGSIFGYGRSGTLERLNMGTLSYELCQNLNTNSTLAYDKFCLRNKNVNTTLCRGDSGGGFVVRRDGAFYLLGIVSYSPQLNLDCVTADFVVMSNVRLMRPDLRDVWQSELKKDHELF